MTEQIKSPKTIKFNTLPQNTQTEVLKLKPRLSNHPDRAIFYCPANGHVCISMKKPSPHVSNSYKMVEMDSQETSSYFVNLQAEQRYLEERVESVNNMIGEDNLFDFMKFLNSQNQSFGKVSEAELTAALEEYTTKFINIHDLA